MSDTLTLDDIKAAVKLLKACGTPNNIKWIVHTDNVGAENVAFALNAKWEPDEIGNQIIGDYLILSRL